ncbi:MAG: hypothetical protein KatS3mg081_1730 [Gemmatimonadales bacterium]|nr:MAG: hypothetical protein KatS3mg081_1730 [Gemmatimonadales bacterium]
MQSHSLKLVTIITEAVIEKELVQELTGLGVSGYTITDARGKGHRGVRTTAMGTRSQHPGRGRL